MFYFFFLSFEEIFEGLSLKNESGYIEHQHWPPLCVFFCFFIPEPPLAALDRKFEYDIDEALAGQYILVPLVSLYIDYLYRHSANIGLLGDFILLYIFWISLHTHTHTEYMAVELRIYI